MQRRNFLQFTAAGFGFSLFESCSNAKSQTTKPENMSHTNKEELKPLIFTPEQKDQIITFAGNEASEIIRLLREESHLGIEVLLADYTDLKRPKTRTFVPTPIQISRNEDESINAQVPTTETPLYGVIKYPNGEISVDPLRKLDNNSGYGWDNNEGGKLDYQLTWNGTQNTVRVLVLDYITKAYSNQFYTAWIKSRGVLPIKPIQNFNDNIIREMRPGYSLQTGQQENQKLNIVIQGGSGSNSEPLILS